MRQVVEACTGSPLVTLAGPGGIGKTSLAAAAAPPRAPLRQPKTQNPRRYAPSTHAKINGATIVASLSTIYFGVLACSLPHVIFSFGTAPEYEP